MKPCRGCGVRHTTALEVRRCFERRRDARLDPARVARQREARRDELERYDPFAEGHLAPGESLQERDARLARAERAAEARERARTAGRAGLLYRSAEAQAFSAAQRYVETQAEEGRTFSPVLDPEAAAALEDFVRDAGAMYEDVEVYTDATWAIPDDRMRTPEQAVFSLREDETAPPVSVWDIEHEASPHWHPAGCQGACCTRSRAMSDPDTGWFDA